jgi:hypothetical protein
MPDLILPDFTGISSRGVSGWLDFGSFSKDVRGIGLKMG